MECTACMPRKPWELQFPAEPEELSGLRRVLRLHLGIWGLHELIDAAQLCVGELVTNVITHVGAGTPVVLTVSVRGKSLRVEVRDPDTRTLPMLIDAHADAECGRGMMLVDALADRWGVQLGEDSKVTWCELETGLAAPYGHVDGENVARAHAVLVHYLPEKPALGLTDSRVGRAVAEEAAVSAIADLLHWFRAHGLDPDEALDRAQVHFESQSSPLAG